MNERTAEAAMTVEEDGIRVEKSFTDDEFPVPAVSYDLTSTREEPTRVRIVDTIPESFPMDRVGFHPDFESENWTAYKDHRVEFERVLDPGEEIRTVFGIRDDDPDLEAFLSTPVIEHVPVDEEIEDVLGSDEGDAVREVLSGDRTTLPGMEEAAEPAGEGVGDEESEPEETVDAERPEPRQVAAETTAAVTRRDAGHEPEPAPADESTEPADSPDSAEPDTPVAPAEPTAGAAETVEAPAAGVAAALANEIRAGDVDDDDLELLREELDLGVPRSVDVRISRLQSSVADVEAYTDALAEFIDEEGTAQEVLDDLQSRVADVEDDVTNLSERVAEGEAERDELVDDVEGVQEALVGVEETVARVEDTIGEVEDTVRSVEGTVEGVVDDVESVETAVTDVEYAVDDLGDDVETLYDQYEETAAGLEDTDERVDDVEAQVDTFDAELGDVWEDIAEVDTRLTDVEDVLGDDLDDVEAEIAEIRDHLAEIDEFRERLNEAFGP